MSFCPNHHHLALCLSSPHCKMSQLGPFLNGLSSEACVCAQRGARVPARAGTWWEGRRKAPSSPSPLRGSGLQCNVLLPSQLSLGKSSRNLPLQHLGEAVLRAQASGRGGGDTCLCCYSPDRKGFTWTLVAEQKLCVPAVTTGSLFVWPFQAQTCGQN